MYECASFIAGYINYEPLDPQTEPPKHLFSPTLTLNSSVGDSFDLSALLCSFLLGSGYDAYVVNGYAPKFITLRDQSKIPCPLIQQQDSSSTASTPLDSNKGNTPSSKSAPSDSTDEQSQSYVPPDNSVKPSKFLADQMEKVRISTLDTFQLWLPEAPAQDERKLSETELERDGIKGSSVNKPIKRAHAWVLVCAGKRDVKETVFVEPSTGRVYNLTSSPYVGIEAVWNDVNYWINTDVDKNVSEVKFKRKKTNLKLTHLPPPPRRRDA